MYFMTSALESLTIANNRVPAELIPGLKISFPNIKKLDCFDMSNQTLAAVCTHLDHLEELRVGTQISDQGLTGITVVKLKKLMKTLTPEEIINFKMFTCIQNLRSMCCVYLSLVNFLCNKYTFCLHRKYFCNLQLFFQT